MTQGLSSRSMAEMALARSTARGEESQRLITEHRRELDEMYGMIHAIKSGGTIIGDGFYIKSDGQAFEVFRRTYGREHVVMNVARVATLFTTAMFFGKL